MKLATNLVLGLNRAALAEGLAFARALGLDPALTLTVLRGELVKPMAEVISDILVTACLVDEPKQGALDRFNSMVKTPTQPGEQIDQPCTLFSEGTVVPGRRMLLTAFGLEVPLPSRTSLAGFAAGWMMVGALSGGSSGS